MSGDKKLNQEARDAWAVISHDMATPYLVLDMCLNSIKKKMPLLIEAYNGLKEQDSAEKLTISEKELNKLLKSLDTCGEEVEYLRQYTRRMDRKYLYNTSAENKTFSIKNCVLETIQSFKSRYDLQNNENVIKDLEECPINFSEETLTHVMYELLSNADYYLQCNRDGKLYITGKTENNNYILSFKNDGIGIPADVAPHIFDPHFSTEKKLGLGLNYCKTILSSMGGDIKCHSHETDFAEFIITIPLGGPTA